MHFVVLGLLVVFVIGFFVVLWKAAPNWRWYHITAAVFLMLLTVAFLFPTAGVLKSRQAWHQVKEKLDDQFRQVSTEHQRLLYGDPNDAEAGQGVTELNHQLSKLSMEAGRRWRSMQQQSVDGETITLAPAPPEAAIPGADGGDAATAAAQLPGEQLVLYAFAESDNGQGTFIPTFYLGEFVVTASTPQSITIQPTAPLEEIQQQAIQDQQATRWSLYELLPLDGHEMFVAAGSVPSDDNVLGRVDEELIRGLFGDPESEQAKQSVDNYLRDGSRAIESDPPLARWTKIEFDKPFKLDVDAEDERSALDGGFFDGAGRAVDGRLQKGAEVEFKPGDQIVIKEERADELRDEGVARLVDEYYLRPLNDYRYILRRLRFRLTELASRIANVQEENRVIRITADKAQSMLVANQDINLKLEQDFEQFRKEKQIIIKYEAELRKRADALRAEMSRLHRDNQLLERKLQMIHGTMAPTSTSLTTQRVTTVR